MTPLHNAGKNHRPDVLGFLLGVSPALATDRVMHGHCAGLTALGLARRVGHPSSDGHAHMLPHTKERRRAAIKVLLDAAIAAGETGEEAHHGIPDPPSADESEAGASARQPADVRESGE